MRDNAHPGVHPIVYKRRILNTMTDIAASMNATTDATIASAIAVKKPLVDRIWFNALWFQSIWFSTVLGGDTLLPLAAGLLLLHLVLVRNTWHELLQLSTHAAIGISVDATLSTAGIFQFPRDVLVPLWLCCLWLGFAATLTRSLAYLGSRPLLVAAAGAVVFPLNYWAGQRLGAVDFPEGLSVTMGIMAVSWMCVLPAMYKVAGQLTRAREHQP